MWTDNGPQFVEKVFAALCAFLGRKQFATTDYHAQSNGQTKLYNKTTVAQKRHFVAEYQRDWDKYIQPLKYANIMQVHRYNGVNRFSLVLSWEPQCRTKRLLS